MPFASEPSIPPTEHAIILAAGRGSRLDPQEDYKLLVEIGGVSMFDRHLRHFSRLGVRHVTVVTGYRHGPLDERIRARKTPEGIDVHVAVNPSFDAGNGLSVLTGADQARRNGAIDHAVPFWMTMSDHVFEASLFDRLSDRIATEQGGLEGMLAVDRKLDTIYDMDDANKIRTTEAGEVEAIGKELETFDLVDVGLFWCGEGFVDALDREREARGDCSTSDAVRRLTDRSKMGLFDIGGALWQDVDTPGAREHAESLEALTVSSPSLQE